MSKAIVLLSGGIDSTTALFLAVAARNRENVVALSIKYGQKHEKEIQRAEKIAAYVEVPFYVLDLSEVFKFSQSSLLQHSLKNVSHDTYDAQLAAAREKGDVTVDTYVPFRNGLFISAAASFGLAMGGDELVYGAHRDDSAGAAYPDCSPEFNEAMAAAIYTGSGGQLSIRAPFIDFNKADIVEVGLKLGVPYEMTWSCYEGEDKACGKCGTCFDRRLAFQKNGAIDPIPYE